MRLPLPRTRRGRVVLTAALAFVLGGAWLGWWYDRHYPWYHFRTVVPGVLYRAGQPSGDDVATAVRDYGVKTVVNLRAERGPWLEEERRAAEALGATFVDLGIPEGRPPSAEQAQRLLELADDPTRKPLLFHCQYGSIRSAAVEALLRIELLGEGNEQALERTRTWGHDLERKYPAIPAFIRSWIPRRDRANAPGRPVPAPR